MKILLAVAALFAMSACAYPASAVTEYTVPVQEFYGPVAHEHCTEYEHRVVDNYHVVTREFHTVCVFPDGREETYLPEEYRHWEYYPYLNVPIIIEPRGREFEHRRR